ncbi:hypothetical protein EYC80_005166 [Monilinia laxa]|uniref:Uncharacterized protein n=1 Tax=Monilinia laxa TaxID=61186 RepID=A0A5N6KJE6_MONLA|nr:hypothetical protein EYC80_005166 [Monilinia laxa]
MADGNEDSYLYMKSCSRPLHELDNGRTDSSKLPSSRIPKKVSADTQSSPTPIVRSPSLKAVVEHSYPNVPQLMEAPTAGPSNYDDCMAFDLYEQDPDMDFDCEEHNLRRESSEFRLNFEDMIVLPMRLKKPSPFLEFGTPVTAVDEFDFADQHVYYSRLITAVNSNSAINEYSTRKGPLWDSAWEMLIPKGLHPAYLTGDEFVKLVLSQGNDTAKWMDVNIPVLHRRALQKAAAARQKLSHAGISPFELTQEYLESFEWMDKIEQDNFIKTMQSLQLQVAFQKQGLSMRIEDIDNITPVDDEKSIGKSHTKLVDGFCIPRDGSHAADEAFMADQISLAEFEDQFWDDDFKQASTLSSSVPIQQRPQSVAAHDYDQHSWETILQSIIHSQSTTQSITQPTSFDPTDKNLEFVETREVQENSDDVHQNAKNTYTIENGSLKLSQFSQILASSRKCCSCSHIPPPLSPKNPDTHAIFTLQDPPPISPTRSVQDGYVSDGSRSVASNLKDNKSSGKRSQMTKSSGSGNQSLTSGKTEGSGKSGKRDSIGKKLNDSPRSLKKKLSSVFGTIGRSGKNKYHVSLEN